MGPDNPLWCARGILVSVRDPLGNIDTVTLDKPFARVGSDYRSDVVLEEGPVPPRALYLHATAEGVYFRRLVPRAPGGAPASGWLAADQIIEVGGYQLAASLSGSDAVASAARLDLRRCRLPEDESPRIRIQRVGLKGPAVEHVCRRPLTIVGRSTPSAIRLKRPLVSRCHCVFFFDQRDLWAIDLLSANGTLLDGRPIDYRRVLPNQVLQLGEIQITYLGVGDGSARPAVNPADESHRISAASVDTPPEFPRMAIPTDVPFGRLPLLSDSGDLPPDFAASLGSGGFESFNDADMSSIALEMSLYACEEKSAHGQTMAGAARAAIMQQFQVEEREALSRSQTNLTARLQLLEQQRDELLQHVGTISSRLHELSRQEQSHALETDQWHHTVNAANQRITELQSALEALQRESQLEADRLKRKCRRLMRRIQRDQLPPDSKGAADE